VLKRFKDDSVSFRYVKLHKSPYSAYRKTFWSPPMKVIEKRNFAAAHFV